MVAHGTAYQAHILGTNFGGKTGTTNEFRSAWFVGFSPDIVVGVFVGFDDNRSLGHGETGAVAAVPIFIDFMQQALKGVPVRDFRAPANAHFAVVNGIREAFQPGSEPHGEELPVVDQVPLAPGELPGPPLPGQRQGPVIAPPPRPVDDLKGLF